MSEAFVVPFDGTVVPESSGGNAAPFPEGWKAIVSILPTNKDGSTITKRPMSKDGPNSVITVQAVRVRIDDGQTGAGRNLFLDVPLARKLKTTSNGKYPDGTPATLFGSYFRALGYNIDDPNGFVIPDDREVFGKKLEVVLGYEKAQNGYEARNRVAFVNKAGDVPNNDHLKAAHDRIIAEHKAAAPAAGQAAAPAAPAPQWTPGQLPAAQPAQPQTAPPAQWSPGAAPAAAPAAQWTPDPADVAAAQQPQQLVGAGF